MSLNDILQFVESDSEVEEPEVEEPEVENEPEVEPEQEGENEEPEQEVEPEPENEVEEPEPVKAKRVYKKKDPSGLTKKQIKLDRQHQKELEVLREKQKLVKIERTASNPVSIAENSSGILIKKFNKDVTKILANFAKNQDKQLLIKKFNDLRMDLDLDFDNVIASIPEKYNVPTRLYDRMDDCIFKNVNKVEDKLE